ncbi:energy transducer TonB [Pseudomonas stutzeri]|uniref:energy transducer TonB n=1 Tax=Stutzerimonas stutzeri TaxID=316 RepID=UPI00236BCA6A|nr:energy transducer TonB [Stutzerimonas stutzeri]
MSSLSMPLPNSFPMARPQWRSHASAVTVTVALHAAVFGLLLHGWTPELTAPSPTQVLKTQLVSLPAPQPVVEALAEPEPVPEPVEAAVEPVLEEPQVDPRIEQHRLEQAELAFKRAEEKKREEAERLEQQRLREQQREREQRRERERQERLEAERREQLAREARQREQAAQAEAAAAERARQAEAAAAASRQYLPIAKDAPDYPQRALDKGIEGACTVSYSVNPQGRIENPKALDDCHPLFIRPSLTAAKSFRYQPRIVDGRAVTVPEVKNTFHYRIQ